jgi:hypothetical protein
MSVHTTSRNRSPTAHDLVPYPSGPLLESLTRAFRKRFEVPDTAVTIADRISQKCHHDWTRAFLVSHREVRSVKPHREVRLAEPHRQVRSSDQHGEVGSGDQHLPSRAAEPLS